MCAGVKDGAFWWCEHFHNDKYIFSNVTSSYTDFTMIIKMKQGG